MKLGVSPNMVKISPTDQHHCIIESALHKLATSVMEPKATVGCAVRMTQQNVNRR